MSRSDQPRVGRIRLTTTCTGARRSVAELDQPAGQPGQPDRVGACPTTTTSSAASSASRVIWLRPGRRRSRRRVLLEAEAGVDDHVALLAAELEEVLDGAGADLDPAVGPGQPGDHARAAGRRRAAREANRSASCPPAASRAAASSPETSSRTPSCWATRPPYGSASTSDRAGRGWPSSAARPGRRWCGRARRPGPQTATTRPAGRRSDRRASAAPRRMRAGAAADRVGQSRRGRRRRRRRGRRSGSRAPAPRRGRAAGRSRPGGRRAGAGGRPPRRRARGVEPDHRHVGLTGGGGGQQVVDVHAALEHHDVRRAPSSASAATPSERRPRR